MSEGASGSGTQRRNAPGSFAAETTAPIGVVPTSLFTDHYELTMVAAALADGTADRRCAFEVFARRLPEGRRYGVVAGTGRLLDAIGRFRFGDAELDRLAGVLGAPMLDWLADYRFTGDVDGYPEGELFFPGSPILSVSASFAEAVVLETLCLSVLNHDCAVAAAAARMVAAAASRPPAPPPTPTCCCTTTSWPPSAARSAASARRPRCWSTPTTSARASRTRSRPPAPSSAPSASTPATWASSHGRPASSST